jgi:hypothetical protein
LHRTQALTFDPAAARAWLGTPSDQAAGQTRARSLGVDDELTRPDVAGFLSTVDYVLAAGPDGLNRRDDITGVHLWLSLDGQVLRQGAVITVDLSNGVRLATGHQGINQFAGPGQRGIPAVLAALQHITSQVCLLLDTYQRANPDYLAVAGIGATTGADADPSVPPGPGLFTDQQVREAINHAADDLLYAVDAGDNILRDGIDLLVDATIYYLLGQAVDPPGAAAHDDDDARTGIGCPGAPR